MREGFEKHVRDFGKDIEERKARGEEGVSEEELQNVEAIAEAAEKMGTEKSTQIEVYYKQQKKQQIMDALHERIRALDDLHARRRARGGKKLFESVGEGKTVYWDDERACFFLRGKKNEGERILSKGEVLTDGMWGVEYRMDESVDYRFAKRFFVEQAKRALYDVLDEQVALTEAKSDVNKGSGKDAAYEAILRRQEHVEKDPNGILAERMTKSFLLKLSYDHDVPFDVEHADPEMDVEDKIDFILNIRGHNRGVDADVGVQFTTSTSEATIRNKKQQIDQVNKRLHVEKEASVQDVVLVVIPLHETGEIFDRWNESKKSGGPDALWSIETKRLIFESVLQKLEHLVPRSEISALWEAIETQLREQEAQEG